MYTPETSALSYDAPEALLWVQIQMQPQKEQKLRIKKIRVDVDVPFITWWIKYFGETDDSPFLHAFRAV